MIDLELNSSIDLKREGKSFYWASFFLPKKSRKNAGILYSICRYFDDIADKNNEVITDLDLVVCNADPPMVYSKL